MRLAQFGVGAILVMFGPLILGPTTPGPFGTMAFAGGLVLMLRNSRWARRRYVILKRRHPKFGHYAEIALRRRRSAPPVRPAADLSPERRGSKAGRTGPTPDPKTTQGTEMPVLPTPS